MADSSSHMSQSCCAENLGDVGPPASPIVGTEVQAPDVPQQENDLVEEPPQEYFCPVTLEFATPSKPNAVVIICPLKSYPGSSEKESRAHYVKILTSQ